MQGGAWGNFLRGGLTWAVLGPPGRETAGGQPGFAEGSQQEEGKDAQKGEAGETPQGSRLCPADPKGACLRDRAWRVGPRVRLRPEASGDAGATVEHKAGQAVDTDGRGPFGREWAELASPSHGCPAGLLWHLLLEGQSIHSSVPRGALHTPRCQLCAPPSPPHQPTSAHLGCCWLQVPILTTPSPLPHLPSIVGSTKQKALGSSWHRPHQNPLLKQQDPCVGAAVWFAVWVPKPGAWFCHLGRKRSGRCRPSAVI